MYIKKILWQFINDNIFHFCYVYLLVLSLSPLSEWLLLNANSSIFQPYHGEILTPLKRLLIIDKKDMLIRNKKYAFPVLCYNTFTLVSIYTMVVYNWYHSQIECVHIGIYFSLIKSVYLSWTKKDMLMRNKKDALPLLYLQTLHILYHIKPSIYYVYISNMLYVLIIL